MNGFLCFDKACHALSVHRVAPLTGAVSSELWSLDRCSILTWGCDSGDVHVASREAESHLILSGYVSEFKDGPSVKSHADRAHVLLKMLDLTTTDDEIAGLCRRLKGSYGICYCNEAKKKFICISDRVNSRPLWACHSNGGWLVSSHPSAIALSLASPVFDSTALSSFLIYGASIKPTRSLFAGVEGIRPGAILHLNEDGGRREHRWYQFHHSPDRTKSVMEWVDLAADRLVQAASRLVRLGESSAIFFSGGVDSRLAAAAMMAAGGDPLLVTLGDSRNLEVRVAQTAAKVMKLRHEVFLRDSEWYLRTFFRAVYEAGGSYVFTHGHFSEAAVQAKKRYGIDTFVLGDFAEAFSKLMCSTDGVKGRMWTPKEFVQTFDSVRLPLYRSSDRDGILSLLNKRIGDQIEEALRVEILERYRELSDSSPEPLIFADYYLCWEAVPTNPTFYMFGDLRAVAAERNVMFDPGVHDLLEILPARMRCGANLGGLLIRRLAPLADWVPNSNTMLPICWSPAAHNLSRMVKPYLGRLRRKLLGNSHRNTGSWPSHEELYIRENNFRRHFGATLQNEDLFDGELFDRDAVRRCWDAFVSGDKRRAVDVEKLAQLGQITMLLRLGGEKYLNQEPGT